VSTDSLYFRKTPKRFCVEYKLRMTVSSSVRFREGLRFFALLRMTRGVSQNDTGVVSQNDRGRKMQLSLSQCRCSVSTAVFSSNQ